MEYKGFVGMFDSFIHNRQIPDLQKLVILKESLLGPALKCAKRLQIEPESCKPMREIPKREFGQSSRARRSHMRELDRILSAGPVITHGKLPVFVNKISQHILALLTLGLTYETLTPAFDSKVLQKLKSDTKLRLSKLLQNTSHSTANRYPQFGSADGVHHGRCLIN